jgi:hypothetical protein
MPDHASLQAAVEEVVAATPVLDMHTHLFAPRFGRLGLWGIDDLLTYHYLEAELFRFSGVAPDAYWALPKPAQADLIWRTLFVENTPLSEATRGVAAVLHALGLDAHARDLKQIRGFFEEQRFDAHLARVLQLAGVRGVVMTNDPLDPAEAAIWDGGGEPDTRFHAALRLDRILNDWRAHCPALAALGFNVDADLSGRTMPEVQRFLEHWCERTKPVYMAVSLPDTFAYPAADARHKILAGAVLPVCRARNIPLALMVGVRRQVNPKLRLAGDGSGQADMTAIDGLCRDFPDNRFLVTVLSRENQHELCISARKFSNLLPFGCWWFLNNPSIVEEITRERLEMLGTSFVPQHSDARILEQLIYKWRNTRRTIAPILARSYQLLAEDGRTVSREEIQRDVERLFRGNFAQWTNLTPA